MTTSGGYTAEFNLTATNGGPNPGDTDTTVTPVSITIAASTPTVAAPTKARAGGGTTFFTGDTMTLSATITNPDGTTPADYSYVLDADRRSHDGPVVDHGCEPDVHPAVERRGPDDDGVHERHRCVSPTSANCPTFKVIGHQDQHRRSRRPQSALAAYASSLADPSGRQRRHRADAAGRGRRSRSTARRRRRRRATRQLRVDADRWPRGDAVEPDAQKPTFTAPAGRSSRATLTFSLVVTDTQSPITGTGTNGNTSTRRRPRSPSCPTTSWPIAGGEPDHGVAGHGGDARRFGVDRPEPGAAHLHVDAGEQRCADGDAVEPERAQKPTFTAPPATTPGGYTAQFNLTATNGGPNPGDSDTTVTPVSITIAASTPTVAAPTKARVGGGTTFFTGDKVTLERRHHQPGRQRTRPTTRTCGRRSSGRTTALSSTTAANPTYTVPSSGATTTACTSGTGASTDVGELPAYKVIVTKTNTGKVSAQSAHAGDYASTLPTRPVANAGTAQNVKVGTATSARRLGVDPGAGPPISYAWTQTGGRR